MVGNDIVDLYLAKTQSNWKRKGFLEKQFTDFEIQEIKKSKNSFLQVWLFWSMKEAAYKCYTQEFKKRFFAPKKFSCSIGSNSDGIVRFKKLEYHIKFLKSNKYIHSLATKENNKEVICKLFFINKNRIQTKVTNQKLLALFPSEVKLQKNDIGVPCLYQKNIKLPVSISTSHHGNYGAFAISNQR